MAEYINREEFIQHIEESDLPDMAKRAVIALVRHMPAADVVEVVWKPVVGYEEDYEVSTTGQVRNKHGTILKPGVKEGTATCYKTVCLSKNGKQKTKYIHRLVAQAFIPNPNDLPMVNHKDEDGTNNFVGNLEWCTREYNANYGTAKERRAKKIRGVPHTEEHNKKIARKMKSYYKVNQSTAKGRRVENGKAVVLVDSFGHEMHFATMQDAALYVNGAYQNIAACCNGKRKTAYGFMWKWDCPNCGAKMDGERKDNNG